MDARKHLASLKENAVFDYKPSGVLQEAKLPSFATERETNASKDSGTGKGPSKWAQYASLTSPPPSDENKGTHGLSRWSAYSGQPGDTHTDLDSAILTFQH